MQKWSSPVSALLLAMMLSCSAAWPAYARAPATGTTAPDSATHPLDPLTVREFAALRKLLLGPGGSSAQTIFSWAQLQEPPKSEVLAFRPGLPLHRQAFVVPFPPRRAPPSRSSPT